LRLTQEREDDVAEAATASIVSILRSFDEATDQVEAMLDIARRYERKADARVLWLIDWIEKNMLDAPGCWNERRLILFTGRRFDGSSTTDDWGGGTGATGFWEPYQAEGRQEQMPR
jgi:hypothetical protein